MNGRISGSAGDGGERFTLANRDHLGVFLAVLQLMGGTCEVCGHGTRRTSKRWAKCKNPECGARVRRRDEAEMDALLADARATRNASVSVSLTEALEPEER